MQMKITQYKLILIDYYSLFNKKRNKENPQTAKD